MQIIQNEEDFPINGILKLHKIYGRSWIVVSTV